MMLECISSWMIKVKLTKEGDVEKSESLGNRYILEYISFSIYIQRDEIWRTQMQGIVDLK